MARAPQEAALKNTGVCPKCASKDIRVSKRKIPASLIPVNRTLFGAAYTSWFICANCGFVETWVESQKDLEKIRKKLPLRG